MTRRIRAPRKFRRQTDRLGVTGSGRVKSPGSKAYALRHIPLSAPLVRVGSPLEPERFGSPGPVLDGPFIALSSVAEGQN
jgi:hypothetical protein